MSHNFYPTQRLSLEQKKKICEWAKENSYKWCVDQLDCSKSFMRQPVEMSFEDIMAKLDDTCHFVIIHRNLGSEDYLEVGFSTMVEQVDYFLWIFLDKKYCYEVEKMIYE